jgi:hypothetical protein
VTSRFNTLYRGAPLDVVAALEDHHDATMDELRLALINAFQRIDALEAAAKPREGA